MDSHQLLDLLQNLPEDKLRDVIQWSSGIISRKHRERLEQLFAEKGMKAKVSDSSNLVCLTSPNFNGGYKKFIAIDFKEGEQTISFRIFYNTIAPAFSRCQTHLCIQPLNGGQEILSDIDWLFDKRPDDVELSEDILRDTLEVVKKCFKQIYELRDELKLR